MRFLAIAVTASALSVPMATAQRVVSTAADRESITLTVYGQGLGLVREVRTMTLPGGETEVRISDVPSRLMPQTVIQRVLGDRQIDLLEQDYRFDLLTPSQLLEHYVGREVTLLREDPESGLERRVTARVISVRESPLFEIDGVITSGFEGRFEFPELPSELVTEPALVWLLQGARGSYTVELSYLTEGLTWNADYVLALDATGTSGAISSWVSINNTSGVAYDDASLAVVAGNVRRVQSAFPQPTAEVAMMRQSQAEMPAVSLGDLHMYSLGRSTSIGNNESKQVAFMGATRVEVTPRYVAGGGPGLFRGDWRRRPSQDPPVQTRLVFNNTESNGLGRPLPAGVVRVYRPDPDGNPQFIGEDTMGHTPAEERVELVTGEAFDLTVDRTQAAYTQIGNCSSESAWQLRAVNRKATEATIEIEENSGGDWTVVDANWEHRRIDAWTFGFDIPLAPGQERVISYTVRVTWC